MNYTAQDKRTFHEISEQTGDNYRQIAAKIFRFAETSRVPFKNHISFLSPTDTRPFRCLRVVFPDNMGMYTVPVHAVVEYTPADFIAKANAAYAAAVPGPNTDPAMTVAELAKFNNHSLARTVGDLMCRADCDVPPGAKACFGTRGSSGSDEEVDFVRVAFGEGVGTVQYEIHVLEELTTSQLVQHLNTAYRRLKKKAQRIEEHKDVPGRKDDAGKPRPSLIPYEALDPIIAVLEFGADRYGVDNWKKVSDPIPRYTNGLLRHVFAYARGEDLDKDSGLHHLAHAGCNILFLLWFLRNVVHRDL